MKIVTYGARGRHAVPHTGRGEGDQPVPVLTDADLLDREWQVARHRDPHRACTVEQVIQIRRKSLIQFHDPIPFLT